MRTPLFFTLVGMLGCQPNYAKVDPVNSDPNNVEPSSEPATEPGTEIDPETGEPIEPEDTIRCCYAIEMYDFGGDGWKRGLLSVMTDDGVYANVSLPDGYEGYREVCITRGEHISFSWNQGLDNEEVALSIFSESFEEILYSAEQPQQGIIAESISTCSDVGGVGPDYQEIDTTQDPIEEVDPTDPDQPYDTTDFAGQYIGVFEMFSPATGEQLCLVDMIIDIDEAGQFSAGEICSIFGHNVYVYHDGMLYPEVYETDPSGINFGFGYISGIVSLSDDTGMIQADAEFYGESVIEGGTLYINTYWDALLYPPNGSPLDIWTIVLPILNEAIGEPMTLVAAFTLLACNSEKDTGEEVRLVDPTSIGEYGVVSRAVTLESTDGISLPTQIWYPSTNPSEGLHRYGDIKEGTASNGGVVDCSQERPVVLFSHGNTAMAYQSYFLAEFLTSHGYLVVAPNHVGNTIFDNDESRKPELILRRPQDISDAYDWLIEQPEFAACIDADAGFAVVGHSFGGYTVHAITGGYLDTDRTLEHCAENGGWLCDHVEEIANTQGPGIYDRSDDRIWGAVSMTPAALETLLGGIESIEVPTLVLAGEYDTLTPAEPLVTAIYENIGTSDKNFGILEKAGHYTFANACDFVNTYPDCGEDHMPIPEAHSLINQLTLAYLERLQGTPDMDAHLPPADANLRWQ